MSTRIFKEEDVIRFEASEGIHVYAYKYSKNVTTIQDMSDYSEINIWTKDIDALIDALIDLKQEIGKLP